MGALLLGRLSFCFCLSVVAIQGKSFVVKRSISIPSSNEGYSKEDHPIISSFHVNSNIEFRYARTTVESHVHNPSNRSQEVAFIVTIPNSAFISNFSMVNDGVEYVAEVAAKEEANKIYQEAVTAGTGAGLVTQDVKYSNKFTVSTNVEPQDKVVFKMTYEELLQRKLGWYEHVINVNPGQAVNNLSIDVNIDESLPLSKLSVPELKMSNDIDFEPGQENKFAQVEWEQGNSTASIKFAPSKEQQEEYGEKGLAGQLLVKYDVERDDKDNEIQVIDGYFVHFFTPDPENLKTLPKHTIFVLDISGSMSGEKILQVKEAMFTILDDMTDQDYFNIITFSSSFNHWKLPSKEHLAHFLPNLHSFESIEATPENRRQAIQYINSINAGEMTNINEALLEGLKLAGEAKKNEALPTNLQSVVVFLSDGDPTSGVTDVNDIKNNVKEANIQVQVPIYSLGFGKSADFNFIRDISTDSGAFAKHIYEDSDAALQLEDFLAEIASPLLSDLKFNYFGDLVDDNSISEKHLSTFYKGGEFVITGKLKTTPQENDTMEVTVSAVGENGTAYDHKTSICWRAASLPGDDNITDIGDDPFERNCSLTYSTTASPRYSQAQKFLKHLYAYLNIKQLSKKIDKNVNGLNPSKEKALRLSLAYNLVTNLTSLVVAKSVEEDAKEVLEEDIGTQIKPQNTSEWSGVSEFASVYNNQGRRHYNEDRAVMHKIRGWTKFSDIHVFSVLDGHGGQMAVELAKKNLFHALEINVRKLKLVTSSMPRMEKLELYRKHFGEVPGAVTQYLDATADVTLSFNKSSSSILSRGSIVNYISVENDILYPQLLTDQVLKCDKDILAVTEAHADRSGSTLLLALMDGAKLWVANVGDSRGVMLDGKGATIPLSFDHKPNDPEEKKRIEESGGFVMFWGVWRVNGILALSRALGDIYLKKNNIVTAEPDVLAFDLNETKADYAVLATDGLWDTHSNEEAVNFLKEKVGNADLDGAEELAKDAIKRGSGDNVTVMVINLKKILSLK